MSYSVGDSLVMKLLFKYITFSIGSLSVSLLILLTSIKPLGAELEIQPEVLFEQGVNLGESGNYQSAIEVFFPSYHSFSFCARALL